MHTEAWCRCSCKKAASHWADRGARPEAGGGSNPAPSFKRQSAPILHRPSQATERVNAARVIKRGQNNLVANSNVNVKKEERYRPAALMDAKISGKTLKKG